MAEKIDITDLLDPQLTDGQKQAIEMAQQHPLIITEDGVLDAARQHTGLSDFGPEDFHERLQLLIDEWNGDRRAYEAKRHFLFSYAVRYASNRLLILRTAAQPAGAAARGRA
jgi:hypothetical protein